MAAHPDYPRTRLYTLDHLQASAALRTDRDQAHYLHHVLRLKTGDAIAVFNGRDGEWLARITYVEKSSVGLQLEKLLRPQKASPDIWLLFAPLKGGKTEFIAEKATELGVSRILPVFTKHTVITRLNNERLQKLAVEAAEQSERLDVPDMREAETLEKILGAWPQDRLLYYCDESGGGEKPEKIFTGTSPCAVLTGPEGGFSPAELALLHKLPFARGLSLGPRILKADTASLVALACIFSHFGDWDDKPAFRTI